MTLHVQQRLVRDVADFRMLPRFDAHVRRIVAEALDVVERTRGVHGGPSVPELPVVDELAREMLGHARS